MLKPYTTSQISRKPIEAAAPNQGAVAFFCSTEIHFLNGFLWYFPISQQRSRRVKTGVFYNLLPEKHYFRLNRAETPFANVVLTEGEESEPIAIREVAA